MNSNDEINSFGRRVVIEFAGMPKSGKSTTLELVRQNIRKKDVRVLDFHGGGRYAPIDKYYGGDLNVYLAAQVISKISNLRSSPNLFQQEIALLDRGIFDRIIFSIALRMIGDISEAEEIAITELLSISRLSRAIDCVYVFRTTPSLSLEREAKVQLLPRHGRIMNTKVLTALSDATEEAISRFDDRFNRIQIIDTAARDGSPDATVTQISEFALSQLDDVK